MLAIADAAIADDASMISTSETSPVCGGGA